MTASIKLKGLGLFSKDEINISIQKNKKGDGINFILNGQKIKANVANVASTARNTVLSNGIENVCLIEHFLAACSIMNLNDIEIETSGNELVLDDGSAAHWQELFTRNNLAHIDDNKKIVQKYDLKTPIFIKNGDREIIAIPHDGFQVSYYMEYKNPVIGKKWASYKFGDDPLKILKARTFGSKEENDFFGVSDRLITFDSKGFNKSLYEDIEPAQHKILDIIGDLRLCGVNPLEINMHVIGFKSGHEMNVDMARELSKIILE